jgi:hypothetical protein
MERLGRSDIDGKPRGSGERVGRRANQFIAKCGDSLREIEESAYWLGLLVEWGVVSVEKLAPLRQEWGERKQSDIDASPKGERFGSESMRRAYRDFRYHPKASEDFVIHFLILPSSFPRVRGEKSETKEVTRARGQLRILLADSTGEDFAEWVKDATGLQRVTHEVWQMKKLNLAFPIYEMASNEFRDAGQLFFHPNGADA